MNYDDDEYGDYLCMHMNQSSHCEECDAYIESRGDIDKCMNCGKYVYGDELNENQICIVGCKNPNEY